MLTFTERMFRAMCSTCWGSKSLNNLPKVTQLDRKSVV